MVKRIDKQDLEHILEHTAHLWEEVRGQNIFITGGTGFFGCWLLESFTFANDQLNLKSKALVLSRDPEAFVVKAPHLANHGAVTLLKGDIRSFDFPPGDFPIVVHAATTARGRLNQEDPLLMLETIVDGTRRVLEFARSHCTNKLLLTSSSAVYGRQPPEMTHLPEDYPGAPNPMDSDSAYGEGKRAAELLCRLYSQKYGFEAKVARCFAFVGPYLPLDDHFAIGNFIRDACRGGPVCVSGDGTPNRSYLYAADLAIWLWTILFKGQTCRPYNVGSDRIITIIELARLVCRLAEPGTEFTVAKQADSSCRPQRYVPAVDRARTELGLETWVSLEKGITRTMKFLSSR